MHGMASHSVGLLNRKSCKLKCCGSGCLSRATDLNSLHPGSGSASNNFKYFNPKKLFPSSRKNDPRCSFRIRILDEKQVSQNQKWFHFSTGKEKNLSQFTENNTFYPEYCHWSLKNMCLGSGIREKNLFRIPNPGVKKAQESIRNTEINPGGIFPIAGYVGT